MKNFIYGLFLVFLRGLLLGLVIAVFSKNQQAKFCPECGTNYPKSAVYCTVDGTELKMRDKGE